MEIYNKLVNAKNLHTDLDLLDEARKWAQVKMAIYQKQMA